MKKSLIALLLLLSALCAQAQIRVMTSADLVKGLPCDKVRFRIAYEMTFVNDTLRRPYHPLKESMILEIGSSVSLFYSYMSFHLDSIFADDVAKGASNAVINEHLQKQESGKVSWKLYDNYPKKGTSSFLDGLGSERYCCVEKIAVPEWKINTDSTKMILGYTCRMATTVYKGRKWCAWYAEEIPIAQGPWKLGGLPGLILRAYDSQRQFSFEAVGMEQVKRDINILYKGEKYEPIDRKVLDKLYARYYADPVGYITNNPNIKLEITDEKGNRVSNPKSVPYNSIER